MKKYTVVQIADILDTNPETVRRWIRSDKLEAEQSSRKQGNTVTEAALQDFLRGAPKYAARFAASEAQMPKSVEVKIVSDVPKTEKNISGRIGAAVVRPVNARGILAGALTPKLEESARVVVKVGLKEEPPKGTEIARLTARMEALQKEMAYINRTLKTMQSEPRVSAVKKK